MEQILLKNILKNQLKDKQVEALDKLVLEHMSKDPYYFPIEMVVYLIKKNKLQNEQKRILKRFFNHINQEMNLRMDVSQILKRRKQIEILNLNEKKIHTFQNKKLRNVVVFGKVANLSPKSQIQIIQTQQQIVKLSQIISNINRIYMIQYFKQKIKLPKYPKNLQLDEFLLNVTPPENFQISSISNQVYNSIYPLIPSIIFTFPFEIQRCQIVNFIRTSQLNCYIDDTPIIAQHSRKNCFYRNYNLKGINFIQQGQVEVPSGRNVARGWVISGTVKSTGYSWKFEPIIFLKFIVKNNNIWKQFVHDLSLNGELPLKMQNILEFEISNSKKQNGYQFSRKINNSFQRNSIKLPVLRHLSTSQLEQIDKIKHWDKKIVNIQAFKKAVLYNKYKPEVNVFIPFFNSIEQKKKLQKSLKRSRRQNTNNMNHLHSKQQQNILIQSVLNKLQSLAEQNENNKKQTETKQFMNLKVIRNLKQDQVYNFHSNRYKKY